MPPSLPRLGSRRRGSTLERWGRTEDASSLGVSDELFVLQSEIGGEGGEGVAVRARQRRGTARTMVLGPSDCGWQEEAKRCAGQWPSPIRAEWGVRSSVATTHKRGSRCGEARASGCDPLGRAGALVLAFAGWRARGVAGTRTSLADLDGRFRGLSRSARRRFPLRPKPSWRGPAHFLQAWSTSLTGEGLQWCAADP
jgi:hypothetical protein